jgi:hypothetical protein
MQIYDNVFNIDGAKINGIVGSSRNNVIIRNNTFYYDSAYGGRLIFADAKDSSGSTGWEVYDNNITVTSNNSYNTQYIVRFRNDVSTGNTGNAVVRNNTIDLTGSTGEIHGISFGDVGTVDTISVRYNLIKGPRDLIRWYSSGATSNIDIYCNDMQLTGGGYQYAVYIGNRTPTDVKFSHNSITTTHPDGDKVYTTAAATGAEFCASGVTSAEITGGGSVSYNTGDCQDGLGGCYSSAGAPASGAPTVTITTSDPQNITSDSLVVAGTCSDGDGVNTSKFRIGAPPSESTGTVCTGTTSWSCATSGYSEGENTLYVGCDDPSDNWGSDSITVNLQTPASVNKPISVGRQVDLGGGVILQIE